MDNAHINASSCLIRHTKMAVYSWAEMKTQAGQLRGRGAYLQGLGCPDSHIFIVTRLYSEWKSPQSGGSIRG